MVDSATVEAGGGDLALEATLTASDSLWLAVRARGETPDGIELLAHSAPVYLVVEGRPFWKPAAVPGIVQRQLHQLHLLDHKHLPMSNCVEAWAVWEAEADGWARQRPLLEGRVAAARARYQELLDRLEAPAAPRR